MYTVYAPVSSTHLQSGDWAHILGGLSIIVSVSIAAGFVAGVDCQL